MMINILKKTIYLFLVISLIKCQNVVKIFTEANFLGESISIKMGENHQGVNIGDINDKVSSIKIAQGFQVIIYEHGDLKGRSKILTKSISDLNDFDFNDKISSLRIETLDVDNEPVVTVYYDSDYKGRYNFFGIGEFSSIWPNDRISSIKVEKGYNVTVFKDGGFRGKSKNFQEDSPKLTVFNDQISSLKITKLTSTSNSTISEKGNDSKKNNIEGLKSVIEKYKSFDRFEKYNTIKWFYSYKDIDEKRAKKAIKKYANDISIDEILFFYYNGVGITGCSFIITSNSFYFLNNVSGYEYGKKGVLDLKTITKFENSRDDIYVYNADGIAAKLYVQKGDISIAGVLNEMISSISKQEPRITAKPKSSFHVNYFNNFKGIGLSDINRKNIINDLKSLEQEFIKTTGINNHYTTKKIDAVNDVQTVITGWRFPNNRAQDAYVSALLRMNNPTEMEANYLKRQFQVPIEKTIDNSTPEKVIKTNKVINVPINLFSIKPTWEQVLKFYGSPMAVMQDGVNQDNFLDEFELKIILNSVEFINSKECLANVSLKTKNAKSKEFHKLPKMSYKYKGTYKIEFSFEDALKGNWTPIKANFIDKKYLPTEAIELPLNPYLDIDHDVYRSSLESRINGKISEYKKLIQYSEEDLNISCKCLNDTDYFNNNAENCEQSLTNTLGFDWQSLDTKTDMGAAAMFENVNKNCKN